MFFSLSSHLLVAFRLGFDTGTGTGIAVDIAIAAVKVPGPGACLVSACLPRLTP